MCTKCLEQRLAQSQHTVNPFSNVVIILKHWTLTHRSSSLSPTPCFLLPFLSHSCFLYGISSQEQCWRLVIIPMSAYCVLLIVSFIHTTPGTDALISILQLRKLTPSGMTYPDISVHSSVQLLSHAQLFATPWTAACQASMSITNSWSLLRLMSIELVMPSNHLTQTYRW